MQAQTAGLSSDSIWLYLAIPVAATFLGGFLSAFLTLGPHIRSAVQHFAAGVIFAAVAGELLPTLGITHQPIPIALGFAAGVALMLLIKSLSSESESDADPTDLTPARSMKTMVTAVAIDALIDGILVGIAFAAGEETGIIFVLALSLEMFFLALSTGAVMARNDHPRSRVLAMTFGIGLLLAAGAIGMTLAAGLLSPTALIVVGGFGAAALLYLVTEELLVEAHETAETPLLTSCFFIGFILIYLIEIR